MFYLSKKNGLHKTLLHRHVLFIKESFALNLDGHQVAREAMYSTINKRIQMSKLKTTPKQSKCHTDSHDVIQIIAIIIVYFLIFIKNHC